MKGPPIPKRLRFNKNKTTEKLVLRVSELSENSGVMAASVLVRPGKRDFRVPLAFCLLPLLQSRCGTEAEDSGLRTGAGQVWS